jgi:hypothetical protein
MTDRMRYDCKIQGCFNIKKRPKIEAFNDCFPGRIGFGDVDAAVEIGGNELKLEFKPAPVLLSTGQGLAFKNTTFVSHITVVLLAGDSEPSPPHVTHISWCADGVFHPWRASDFSAACEEIKSWSLWARANPKRERKPQIGDSFLPRCPVAAA